MVFDETDARLTWVNDIMPFVFRRAKAQLHPTTVFIGGQPAAGKTSGQELARNLHQDITPIVGDDYRQYHPATNACWKKTHSICPRSPLNLQVYGLVCA